MVRIEHDVTLKPTILGSIDKLEEMVRNTLPTPQPVFITNNLQSSGTLILEIKLVDTNINYNTPLPPQTKFWVRCELDDYADDVVKDIVQQLKIHMVVNQRVGDALKGLQTEMHDLSSKHYREQDRLDSLIMALKKIPFIKNYILKKKVFDL